MIMFLSTKLLNSCSTSPLWKWSELWLTLSFPSHDLILAIYQWHHRHLPPAACFCLSSLPVLPTPGLQKVLSKGGLLYRQPDTSSAGSHRRKDARPPLITHQTPGLDERDTTPAHFHANEIWSNSWYWSPFIKTPTMVPSCYQDNWLVKASCLPYIVLPWSHIDTLGIPSTPPPVPRNR